MNAPAIVIAGGGTGGHLFPGVALADELSRRGATITFVGTSRGIEARVIPQTPYTLALIDVAGLKGQGLRATLRNLLRLPLSLLQAHRLLGRIRPAAVVGVGGYASGPLVLVAALRGIPSVILEQNSIPGITNKILSRFVRSVVIAFPQAADYFPRHKVFPLGNPIRAAIAAQATDPAQPISSTPLTNRTAAPESSSPLTNRTAAPESSSPLTNPAAAVESSISLTSAAAPIRILVLGGSQGATAVNDLFTAAVAAAATQNPAVRDRLRIHHQTGAKDRDRIAERYRAAGFTDTQAQVSDFIADMGAAYRDCDLMVGRAGATTIAELTAIGRPALLIPFPQATDDHQTHNAHFMVAEGAAELWPQATTTAAALAARLLTLAGLVDAPQGDPPRVQLARMAARSRALGRPDAARTIADHIQSLAAITPAAAPSKEPPRP